MTRFSALANRFARDRSGATAIEYALIAAIICIGIIVSLTAVGDGLSMRFNQIVAAFPA